MKTCCLLIFACFAVILTGCRNEKKTKKNMQHLYFDYKLSGDETSGLITCTVQYKEDGPEGLAITMEQPASVELDGKPLPYDSTHFMGPYYERTMPTDSFSGRHSIVFTGPDQKTYRDEFDFTPFQLASELPGTITRKPFTLSFTGLADEVRNLRLVMIDTSFSTPDVNEVLPVQNGQLTVPAPLLNNIANGPIVLQVYLEEEKPLKSHLGRLSIDYNLSASVEMSQ